MAREKGNNRESILVIEDDKDISELVVFHLGREGYRTRTISTGAGALLEIGRHPPDLLLLDLMLPGLSGLEICKNVRNNDETRHIPVIMVTAKGEEDDITRGLELGADDYITKPFSPAVLVARVKSVLRRYREQKRAGITDEFPINLGKLTIDPQKHKVLADGVEVSLTITEFRILYFLAQNPGRVFTRSRIVETVQGDAYHVTDRSVDVLVFGLRKKLLSCSDYVETVRGIGYRFKETV